MNRPRLTLGLAALGVAVLLTTASDARAQSADPNDPWTRLPGILAGIKAPVFPARDFVITAFGARPDGVSDATEALRKAIAECVRAGGGRVVVPAGEFLTGPIHLMSGVNLHVQKGATLRFSTDPARYLPVVKTRFEGVELMNYSPLIYARGQENIAVTGEGTLDGQASDLNWWKWKGGAAAGAETQRPDRDQLFKQAEDSVPVEQRVYGAGHFLRPTFIEPYESRNILIEGVTIRNAPFWIIHPTLSSNITIRGVTVISHGPNNDGADPESSTDVLIENAVFDTGDDCIAIKSGRNADGRRVNRPSERIVIRNSTMRAGHGGVTVGSEVSGSVRDVFAEKLVMSSPDLERGIRLKTNAVRGGVIENVFARDIEIGEVGSAIDIDLLYEEGARGSFLPTVRNVRVERLSVKKAAYAFFVRGLPGAPVRGLSVLDSTIQGVSKGSLIQGLEDLVLRNVTIAPADQKRPGSQAGAPVK
ncbi:MAG: glycoside hydrolase family 28 protein [Vicinamibacteria bacterium]|nr:glycoside hydrolase family 28 protein [Vicinamibacteria bacterium]